MTEERDRRVLRACALADLAVEERMLVPPVDVESLVASHADVRRLPLDSNTLDAVVHGLRGGRHRPVVVLNDERPHTRIRFTLAHELGHLLLAWHIGTIECHVDDDDDDRAGLVVPFEREADAFASRLLVPARFVREISALPEPEMLARLAEAEVSPDAGLRSLAALLPAGHVFALLDYTGTRVAGSYRSPGTDNPDLPRGSVFDQGRFRRMFGRQGLARHRGRHVWWGTHAASSPVGDGDDQWEPLLTRILAEVAPGETRGGELWRQANAVAGHALGDWKQGAAGGTPLGDLGAGAALLRRRFLRRGHLQDLAEHPLFDEYAASRARAFANGRRAR